MADIQDTSYGKMFPEFYQAFPTTLPIRVYRRTEWKKGPNGWEKINTTLTKAMRSHASWPDFKNSGMVLPTELLTLNTSEFHKGAEESSLSDILETGDHLSRYCLSAEACMGILRRAEKRGKKLPAPLEKVLTAQAMGLLEPLPKSGAREAVGQQEMSATI